ncbi:MAG: hypothetical protein H6642_08465 [Caldilineaceae bacterium]|nr:hypothetical protein [Caldilineaceae bacterium]
MSRRLGTLQYGIIALTVATALIHLALAPKAGSLFWLNGLGYLGLLILLFFPSPALTPYRSIIRWALIVFTIVTIVAWVSFGTRSPLAYLDKVIEVVLVGLLWLDGQAKTT